MAAIGDGWEDGAWVKESWIDTAWVGGVVVAAVSRTGIRIAIGLYGFMLVMGRAALSIGQWW